MSKACEINNNQESSQFFTYELSAKKNVEQSNGDTFWAAKSYFQCKENSLGTKIRYFKF